MNKKTKQCLEKNNNFEQKIKKRVILHLYDFSYLENWIDY